MKTNRKYGYKYLGFGEKKVMERCLVKYILDLEKCEKELGKHRILLEKRGCFGNPAIIYDFFYSIVEGSLSPMDIIKLGQTKFNPHVYFMVLFLVAYCLYLIRLAQVVLELEVEDVHFEE